MLPVRIVRRQRQFNVTGQLEPAGAGGPIDQRHPPNLHVIFRRDDDLGFALDVVVDAPEHGAVQREVDANCLNLAAGWMIGVAPQPARIDVVDVTEGSPRIPGRVRSPARDLEVAPAAVAAAGVRQHQAIAAVAQQLGLGRGGMGRIELADRGRDFADGRHRRDSLARGDVVQRRKVRDAFLKQGLDRAHARVGVEMAPEAVVMQEIGQRQETHALMMRHVGAHDHAALALAAWVAGCSPEIRNSRNRSAAPDRPAVSGSARIPAVRYSPPAAWHRARRRSSPPSRA